jgi:carboxynorspermidine decarboxylase
VNPEHSEGANPLYDPCGPGSRLGARRVDIGPDDVRGLSGCTSTPVRAERRAPERTLAAFEAGFGDLLPGLDYVNFGGGHHITRATTTANGL